MAQLRGSRRPGPRPRGTVRGTVRGAPAQRFELLFLPGLENVVAAEAESVLDRPVRPVPGRDDSLSVDFAGRWNRLLALRTPVAAFAVLSFPVPRPKSLLSGDYFDQIARAVDRVRHLDADGPPATSFRFEAAGADSPVFTRLAGELSAATGLAHRQADGDVVLRWRRSVRLDDGWDVLVRLSTRPLSHRPWRVRNFPGAVNATIAAAIARLSEPADGDRVVNLMCGSGTLLIERLLAGPARCALGVDTDAAAVRAAEDNVEAAGLGARCDLLRADATGGDWLDRGPFDVLLADPPWGGLVGEHLRNEALHLALLNRAREAAADGARFLVLTHEIRQMERCLRRTADLWRVRDVVRVFQKGHHPRIYLLQPV
jgi:tRNA (guanine6-N2)-methyltransferase